MSRLTESWTDEARKKSLETRQAHAHSNVSAPSESAADAPKLPDHHAVQGVVSEIFAEGRKMLSGQKPDAASSTAREHSAKADAASDAAKQAGTADAHKAAFTAHHNAASQHLNAGNAALDAGDMGKASEHFQKQEEHNRKADAHGMTQAAGGTLAGDQPGGVDLHSAVHDAFKRLADTGKYTAGGQTLVPIHEVRSEIAKSHGGQHAGHDAFDPAVREGEKSGHFSRVAISDRSKFSDQQMADSIKGGGNDVFGYLERWESGKSGSQSSGGQPAGFTRKDHATHATASDAGKYLKDAISQPMDAAHSSHLNGLIDHVGSKFGHAGLKDFVANSGLSNAHIGKTKAETLETLHTTIRYRSVGQRFGNSPPVETAPAPAAPSAPSFTKKGHNEHASAADAGKYLGEALKQPLTELGHLEHMHGLTAHVGDEWGHAGLRDLVKHSGMDSSIIGASSADTKANIGKHIEGQHAAQSGEPEPLPESGVLDRSSARQRQHYVVWTPHQTDTIHVGVSYKSAEEAGAMVSKNTPLNVQMAYEKPMKYEDVQGMMDDLAKREGVGGLKVKVHHGHAVDPKIYGTL